MSKSESKPSNNTEQVHLRRGFSIYVSFPSLAALTRTDMLLNLYWSPKGCPGD